MTLPLPRPASDSPALRELCERLSPGVVPDCLDVESPPGMTVNDCFPNVEKIIAAHGGGIQHGWLLWETLPGLMLSAEFHAVWVDKQGMLREVTPKELPFERIAFLPDPVRRYEGRQVNNVRVALKDDPLIHQFIDYEERKFRMMNEGELADYHGQVSIPGSFMQEGALLFGQIFQKYFV